MDTLWKTVAWIGPAVGIVLASCATTTLYQAQRSPAFRSHDIHRVLVISLNPDSAIRAAVEDEFARQWRARGVDAQPSHVVLPPETPLQKTTIAPIAKAHGYDTVSVTQLLGSSKIDPHIPRQAFDVETSTDDATLTQYFQAVVASPAYAANYQLAAVNARLYKVATEKLLWSGTSQTLIVKNLRQLIPEYVKVVLKALYAKPR